jgi:hypothetical protein
VKICLQCSLADILDGVLPPPGGSLMEDAAAFRQARDTSQVEQVRPVAGDQGGANIRQAVLRREIEQDFRLAPAELPPRLDAPKAQVDQAQGVLHPQPLGADIGGRHWPVVLWKNEPEMALDPGVQRSDQGGVGEGHLGVDQEAS